ncbi:Scarecrow-like protein 1 [Capsicum baccatum]|uniref:Scarecrow-like protein 1 n=1 Tax=Capsicum baccatum TaxID=33114 RepID=A0A2G2WJD7_CAPBA|nr:Scarecrow-like protein 1 [Capsicum baccatum]
MDEINGGCDPESVQHATRGLNIIGLRLEKLAEALQLLFGFQAVLSRTALFSLSMLNIQLLCELCLPASYMPDESVSTVTQRDQLLRMVKSLNPKVVTVVEQEVNDNTAPFPQRIAKSITTTLLYLSPVRVKFVQPSSGSWRTGFPGTMYVLPRDCAAVQQATLGDASPSIKNPWHGIKIIITSTHSTSAFDKFTKQRDITKNAGGEE